MRNSIDMIVQKLAAADARSWAVLASLALSAYASFAIEALNDDAFLYVRTAQIFMEDGFSAAFAHYPWAGYPVLLGLTASVGLELIAAAHLLNALFFALLTFAFVSICREFSADRGLLTLAALTILLFPEINEYRFLILRDAGFWAFSLLGLWSLIRYAANAGGTWKFACCFCGAMLLAAIFRPEALFYLLLAPLGLLLDQRRDRRERYRRLLRLETLAITAVLACFLAGLAFDLNALRQVGTLGAGYSQFLQSLLNPGDQQVAAMAEAIFGEYAATYSARYLPIVLLVGLLLILLVELLYAVGMPFTLILAWGWWKMRLPRDRGMVLPVISFALLNLLIVLAFLLLARYLTSRYAMLFALSLALAVPFIAREALARGARLAPWLLALFFVFSVVDSYYSFGKPKSYVADAVEWLEENREQGAKLLTNNRAVAYYSGMVVEFDRTQSRLDEEQLRALAPGDLVAIENPSANARILARPELAELLAPAIGFPGAGEARIRIYRRVAP